jgi:hypothetical protein
MVPRTLNEKDYKLILDMDKKVYPTFSPVTKDIIKSWYIKNPEFGVIFEENQKIIGVLIAIPLNERSWKKLINGNLKESEMNEKTIFDNLMDKKLGIHLYHIEKLDANIKEFYKISLTHLASLLDNLKKKNNNLKIIGFSGLCVTPEGINLFEKRLNCKERDFVIQEHILEKDEQKIVLETDSKEIIHNKINEGYNYITKCKMLVLYPNEESMVWSYLNNLR